MTDSSFDAQKLICSVLADFLTEGSFGGIPDVHLKWIRWKQHYLTSQQQQQQQQEEQKDEKTIIAEEIYKEKFGGKEKTEKAPAKKFRLVVPETENDLTFFDDFIKDLESTTKKVVKNKKRNGIPQKVRADIRKFRLETPETESDFSFFDDLIDDLLLFDNKRLM